MLATKLILLLGDCRGRMREIPDQSVHTCVTSTPYFSLRNYGMERQIGFEETPKAFVQRLVELLREVRRVLRDDGGLWVNLGDSYVSHKPPSGAMHSQSKGTGEQTAAFDAARKKADLRGKSSLKDKDLIGVPWIFAFAVRRDGWYLRQDITWHKSNPMPESVRDRFTKSHEHIFMLSKSPSYCFDHMKIQEDAITSTGKQNKRDVWCVPIRPYKGAHFATLLPELIEPCILSDAPVDRTTLDPFGGSGTTAGVALKHGGKGPLCELDPEYGEMVSTRMRYIVGETGSSKPSVITLPVSMNDNDVGATVWELILRNEMKAA